MKRIMCDSGGFIAAGVAKDVNHAIARGWLREHTGPLAITTAVVDEAVTRLRYVAGLQAALDAWSRFEAMTSRGRLQIIEVDRDLQQRGIEVMARLRDIDLSLTDATTIAVARDLGCDTVFGFDEDFEAAGFTLVPPRKAREDAAPYEHRAPILDES